MLEPQSTLFFVFLVVVFIGMLWWLLVTRHLVLRILSALLAFTSAMLVRNRHRQQVLRLLPDLERGLVTSLARAVPATSVSITGGPRTVNASLGHFDVAIARQ